jgi:iron complex transport system substrate-binding protein
VRIVSLLPSATDLVCALGLFDCLVGRTHECDWPLGIEEVPVMTADVLKVASMASCEIDAAVGAAAHSGSSIYALDRDALAEARPDLILTQELCDVCAVSYREVAAAARLLEVGPKVVSLEPRCLEDVWENVSFVGRLTGAGEAAEAVVTDARARLEALRRATERERALRVFCVEWLDPVYAAGHWVPEQVAVAGGLEGLAEAGRDSRRIGWERVLSYRPEAVVLMPCGMPIERTLAELEVLTSRPGWERLPAVVEGRVWAVDGPSYFNRPGPRVVRGAEILGALLHGVGECRPGEAVALPVGSRPS